VLRGADERAGREGTSGAGVARWALAALAESQAAGHAGRLERSFVSLISPFPIPSSVDLHGRRFSFPLSFSCAYFDEQPQSQETLLASRVPSLLSLCPHRGWRKEPPARRSSSPTSLLSLFCYLTRTRKNDRYVLLPSSTSRSRSPSSPAAASRSPLPSSALHGVFAPLCTFFHPGSEDLDLETFREHVKFIAGTGGAVYFLVFLLFLPVDDALTSSRHQNSRNRRTREHGRRYAALFPSLPPPLTLTSRNSPSPLLLRTHPRRPRRPVRSRLRPISECCPSRRRYLCAVDSRDDRVDEGSGGGRSGLCDGSLWRLR
jgi:hypothetical protein